MTYVPVQDDADIRLRLRERRADSSRPLLRDVAAATSNSGEISEVEPLSDAVRNLQQAMFTLSRQMGDIVQSQRDSADDAAAVRSFYVEYATPTSDRVHVDDRDGKT